MLRADLMPAGHRRHDRAWRKRFRDDPTLVRVTPPSPATNATANLDAPSRRGSVNYMVDHICEPMPSTGSHLPNYAARCKMGERHRLQYILPNRTCGATAYSGDVFRIDLRNAPHVLAPRLEMVLGEPAAHRLA